MGFFGKIKQNLDHGGVKVQLQAPASAPTRNSLIPVTVTVTATDAAVQIKKVWAQLDGRLMTSLNNPNNVAGAPDQTFAYADDTTLFNLNPGESKTLQLNLGASAAQAAAPAAGIMGKLENMSQNMSGNRYIYYVKAYAEVGGIALAPGATQSIQIDSQGLINTAINIKL